MQCWLAEGSHAACVRLETPAVTSSGPVVGLAVSPGQEKTRRSPQPDKDGFSGSAMERLPKSNSRISVIGRTA